ncbi:MAG TPA: N-acetylmuramoyl-L-alanine amidase [Acidisarcina sp.]
MREALEARAEQQRTRSEYSRVLDAFRAIYHDDPASPRADASIFAVAGLLGEQGRIFGDRKSLNDAIAEYEFLRREYPGSRYRFSGLMTEGEIYRRNLGDRDSARNVFQTFLRLYPHHPLAVDAGRQIAELHAEELAERRSKSHRRGREAGSAASTAAAGASGGGDQSAEGAPAVRLDRSGPGAKSLGMNSPGTTSPGTTSAGERGSTASGPAAGRLGEAVSPAADRASQAPTAAAAEGPAGAGPAAGGMVARGSSSAASSTPPPAGEPAAAHPPALTSTAPMRRGRLPLVTGVRHWSTPVYTRVAIDLQDEVSYEAARVPDPDRIFFDLHGARLSPELIGKSVQVTDDGFLKRIRVAQYSNDVSRIVLDVSDVSDYSAFLLPNPYRLIIDIHGRKGGAGTGPPQLQAGGSPAPAGSHGAGVGSPSPASGAGSTGSTGASSHGPAAQTVNSGGRNTSGLEAAHPGLPPSAAAQTVGRNAPPQPASGNEAGGARPASSLGEVASLGRQPNRVSATRRPTTAPIAASVAGTVAAPQPNAASGPAQTLRPGDAGRASRQASSSGAGLNGVHEAEPTAGGGRSLSRALGLKIGRIVVDAGHGGHDSGTLGPDGIEEKDVVLDVALRLGRLLKQRLGADVIFTRDDDTFIPLETRTAIANKAQADLFISVHANSSQDPDARGVETYYLSFTSSADALEVAARENVVSQQSIHQLADLVKKIAMQDKIDESREFAGDVERSLYEGLTTGESQNASLHDRGVKKAPFVVLIGANMPSILAEISFLTNPEDARQLRDPKYRQRIADSLYQGVARYVGGLSGVRLADNMPRR